MDKIVNYSIVENVRVRVIRQPKGQSFLVMRKIDKKCISTGRLLIWNTVTPDSYGITHTHVFVNFYRKAIT